MKWICSDEGLALETSAFESLYGGHGKGVEEHDRFLLALLDKLSEVDLLRRGASARNASFRIALR